MDIPQSTDLGQVLASMPDPRHARGRRYPWPVLLTLIAAAVASGQQGVRAIAQWMREHAAEVGPAMGLAARIPSEATVRRALRVLDPSTLEARLAAFTQALPMPAPGPAPATPVAAWVGLALDGKAVCGANRHGAQVHLLSLVRHADGRVVDEVLVPPRRTKSPPPRRCWPARHCPGPW